MNRKQKKAAAMNRKQKKSAAMNRTQEKVPSSSETVPGTKPDENSDKVFSNKEPFNNYVQEYIANRAMEKALAEEAAKKVTIRQRGANYSGYSKNCPNSVEPSERLTSVPSLKDLSYPFMKVNSKGLYQCTVCEGNILLKQFKDKYSFNRHAFFCHDGLRKVFLCSICRQEFSRPGEIKVHMKRAHPVKKYSEDE